MPPVPAVAAPVPGADARLLNAAFNAAPGVLAVVRASDLCIVHVNGQFSHFMGYSQNDIATGSLLFTNILDSYFHARLQFQLADINENPAKGFAYVMYKVKSKQGQLVSCYIFASPFISEEGINMYTFFILPDVSSWSMPFSSFETREIFLELFQKENFGTFEWLVASNLLFWSPGMYNIYEIEDQNRSINREFARSFVHPGELIKTTRAMENALMHGRQIELEFRVITQKGNIKVLQSLSRMITDADGVPVRLVGCVRDITGQKGIEESLRMKVEELYNSNKELEDFAYVASHDLQEPLRKITTFGSRLAEKFGSKLEGEGALYLSRMTASADNMRRLIDDLLDFSRITNASHPFQSTNLADVLNEVLGDLELIIEESGTQVTMGQMPVLEAIPSQMKQLFTNIISNAIKFRRKEVLPLIGISAEQATASEIAASGLSQNADYCRITIADNGIGFEPEYASRIFMVFQRLHGRSEYPGTGVGLAICKKITEHHKGTIFAEGNPGDGAIFTIYLPLRQ